MASSRRTGLEVLLAVVIGLVWPSVVGRVLVSVGVNPFWLHYPAFLVGSLFGGAHDLRFVIGAILFEWLIHSIVALGCIHLCWTMVTRIGASRPRSGDAELS